MLWFFVFFTHSPTAPPHPQRSPTHWILPFVFPLWALHRVCPAFGSLAFLSRHQHESPRGEGELGGSGDEWLKDLDRELSGDIPLARPGTELEAARLHAGVGQDTEADPGAPSLASSPRSPGALRSPSETHDLLSSMCLPWPSSELTPAVGAHRHSSCY